MVPFPEESRGDIHVGADQGRHESHVLPVDPQSLDAGMAEVSREARERHPFAMCRGNVTAGRPGLDRGV